MVAGVDLLSCKFGVEGSEGAEGVFSSEDEQFVNVYYCFSF